MPALLSSTSRRCWNSAASSFRYRLTSVCKSFTLSNCSPSAPALSAASACALACRSTTCMLSWVCARRSSSKCSCNDWLTCPPPPSWSRRDKTAPSTPAMRDRTSVRTCDTIVSRSSSCDVTRSKSSAPAACCFFCSTLQSSSSSRYATNMFLTIPSISCFCLETACTAKSRKSSCRERSCSRMLANSRSDLTFESSNVWTAWLCSREAMVCPSSKRLTCECKDRICSASISARFSARSKADSTLASALPSRSWANRSWRSRAFTTDSNCKNFCSCPRWAL
mmetsp:Transcript_113800/g.261270  ORF Transcript_113800/g.261270 Transcript_113800/m.261270 type:complete len:281 (-) Transcript_113800:43-885(-)